MELKIQNDYQAPGVSTAERVAHPKIAKVIRKAVKRFMKSFDGNYRITGIRLGKLAYERYRKATDGQPESLVLAPANRLFDGDTHFFRVKIGLESKTLEVRAIRSEALDDHDMVIHAEGEKPAEEPSDSDEGAPTSDES